MNKTSNSLKGCKLRGKFFKTLCLRQPHYSKTNLWAVHREVMVTNEQNSNEVFTHFLNETYTTKLIRCIILKSTVNRGCLFLHKRMVQSYTTTAISYIAINSNFMKEVDGEKLHKKSKLDWMSAPMPNV